MASHTKIANIAMVKIGRSGDKNQIELTIETAKPIELLKNNQDKIYWYNLCLNNNMIIYIKNKEINITGIKIFNVKKV